MTRRVSVEVRFTSCRTTSRRRTCTCGSDSPASCSCGGTSSSPRCTRPSTAPRSPSPRSTPSSSSGIGNFSFMISRLRTRLVPLRHYKDFCSSTKVTVGYNIFLLRVCKCMCLQSIRCGTAIFSNSEGKWNDSIYFSVCLLAVRVATLIWDQVANILGNVRFRNRSGWMRPKSLGRCSTRVTLWLRFNLWCLFERTITWKLNSFEMWTVKNFTCSHLLYIAGISRCWNVSLEWYICSSWRTWSCSRWLTHNRKCCFIILKISVFWRYVQLVLLQEKRNKKN